MPLQKQTQTPTMPINGGGGGGGGGEESEPAGRAKVVEALKGRSELGLGAGQVMVSDTQIDAGSLNIGDAIPLVIEAQLASYDPQKGILTFNINTIGVRG